MNIAKVLQSDLNERRERKLSLRPDPEHNKSPSSQREIGGMVGPDPTRYGDWEVNGRCTDF